MADITNLISDIRTALAYSESVPPDTLRQYASAYAAECNKVNERLKQCLPHLRSGNIAEAVRIAETSPDLTETFNLLDFENRQDWLEICDSLGYDVPLPLAVDIFQELEDAYVQFAPLEPLLRWHRLHALNGSPIRERLAVLRAIAKADPMNLHWQEDQETFEKARIKELGQEVADALAQNDLSRLRELYRELTAPGWQVAPPPEYRLKICTAVLEQHADELMQHFSAFNHPVASIVYQSMQQVLVANQMAMPAAIEKNIMAAVRWLQATAHEETSLQQFHREIETLREALDVYTPRATLENLYYALQNTATHVNRAIPAELDAHYHSRLDYLTRIEKRRYAIVVTVFAGSILLVAAFLIYALSERTFTEQVAKTLETLQKLESENQIDSIEQALQSIKPNLATSPKVEPVIARLQAMLDKDNERAKEFDRYCVQADLLMEQKPEMSGLRAAKASVDQANRLKRTPQEITRYTEVRSRYDTLYREEQNKADRAFSGQFATFRQEYNNLPRSANAQYPADALVDQLQTLSANVRNLLTQNPDISEQQKQEGNSLLTSIDDRQRSLLQTLAETEGFQQIFSRIRDLPSCKRVLEDFSTRFPNHPASGDIQELLKNFDSIQEVAQLLQELCRSYSTSAIEYLRVQRAVMSIKDQYETAAAKIANIEAAFPPAKNALTLAKMKPIDGDTFKATEELLKTVARRDLYPWINEKEDWHYLTTKPNIDANGRISNAGQLEYVATLVASPKKYTVTSNTVERNKGNHDLLQSTFANEALRQLDRITTDADSRENAAEIIGKLLVQMKEAPGIDPILKVILFHLFISDYSNVDPIFADNFRRVLTLIEGGDVELTANWMDVESRSTIPQRQRASVILNRLTGTYDLQTLADKTKRETEEFRKNLSGVHPQFEFVGLMTRQERQWSFMPVVSSLPSPSGKLFVLRMSGAQVQPVQVGTVWNGQITLSGGMNVLQCSPVFFVN